MINNSDWQFESEVDKMLRQISSSTAKSLLFRAIAYDIRPAICSTRKSSTNPLNLPHLPVPKLSDTLSKFLLTAQPHLTPEAFENTRKAVEKFGSPGGPGEKLQKLLEKRATEKENWLSDWWLQCAYLEYRDPVVVWSSPGLVWEQKKFSSESDRLKYTAKVVSAALQYIRRIYNKEIPVERMGKAPLDMAQYEKIFGTCRIPGIKSDSVEYHPESQHIVVIIDNEFYKVPVFNGDEVLSEAQILNQLEACMKLRGNEAAPIGLLTSDNRDNWGKAYAELIKDSTNQSSVKEIQSALFTVSLDKFQAKVEGADDIITAEHQLIHGGGSKYNSANRWYDKTVQFIVGENGINGLTYEHSPAEGVPIAVMSDYIMKYVEKNYHWNPKDASKVLTPTKLSFKVVSPKVEEAIQIASKNINDLAANIHMDYLHFTKFGKNFIKSQKMSPDSFIQMAIQLAFYRLHRVPGAQYESAALRLYVHGRTETIRSCSNESIAFAKSMCDTTPDVERVKKLTDAINGHKKYVAAAIQGFGIDRHLLGLKLIAKENNIPIPEFYGDEGVTKSAHMRLSTSQVASKFNAFMCYGPLTQDGYACCYSPRDEDMWFGISSLHSNPETNSAKFRKSLEESLTEMHNLLVRTAVPKSKL